MCLILLKTIAVAGAGLLLCGERQRRRTGFFSSKSLVGDPQVGLSGSDSLRSIAVFRWAQL